MTDTTVDPRFEALRAPFRANKIGKLPKVWCGACRSATKQAKRTDACGQHNHRVETCRTCKARLTTAHMHVDYVGHAHVTERLLEVDPTWSWEPVALNEQGTPLLDGNGGLWIRLTVAGVTRLGYGHPDGKSGGDAVKETIGDAIRNAALRFGVAIDLWMKERATGSGEAMPDEPEAQVGDEALVTMRRRIVNAGAVRGYPALALIEDDFREWSRGKEITDADVATLAEYLTVMERKPRDANGVPA